MNDAFTADMARDHQDRHVGVGAVRRIGGTDAVRHLETVHRLHRAVGDDDVGPVFGEGVEPAKPIGRFEYLFDTHRFEQGREKAAHFRAVLDDENLQLAEKVSVRPCRRRCHP